MNCVKKLLILIAHLLIFLMGTSYGQEVNCEDLLAKLKCESFSCFNDYITKNGFCFFEADKDNNEGVVYKYYSCDYITNGLKEIKTKNHSSILFSKDGTVSVNVSTSSNDYYKRLIDEAKELGFIEIETNDDNPNKIMVAYTSTKFQNVVMLVTTNAVSKQGVGNWTIWEFSFFEDI